MGKLMLIIVALIMFIMGCCLNGSNAEMDEESTVIHVVGKVMCQDCSGSWNDWAQGKRPIKGSKVCITCLDERKKMVHYGSDTTDDDGEYNLVVKKIVYGKELNPRNCLVRLVSSPDPTCNIATNFARGLDGVKLRQPAIVYRDMIKYFLGPFYYTTPQCDEPDTTNQGSY